MRSVLCQVSAMLAPGAAVAGVLDADGQCALALAPAELLRFAVEADALQGEEVRGRGGPCFPRRVDG